MQRGGAARQGDRVVDAEVGGELLLEGVDLRTEGSDPVGVERLEQQGALDVGHFGRRQEDPTQNPYDTADRSVTRCRTG